MPEYHLVQLTTVHPRADTRILHREVRSLAQLESAVLTLVVADGDGANNHTVDGTSVPVLDIGRSGGGRIGRALISPWRAVATVRRIGADIVHFHDPELIPAGIMMKLMGLKVVYDVHEDVPRQILSKQWLPWVLRRPAALVMEGMEWVAGRAFDAIVSATPEIAKRFPVQKTTVVQNFPVSSELNISNQKPYQSRQNVFVYIGGLATVRGVREIVSAVGLLAGKCNATLELAGTFHPAQLEAEVNVLPEWSCVKYHGWATRTQVADLLGRARAGLVVLHPIVNYIDAYPVKMFEYMAAGLPVIASNFPLWREIVETANCGLVVDPLNPGAIADAMKWMLNNPVEAEAMGQRGKQAVSRQYNWEAESEKLLGLYRDLFQAG